MALRFLSSPREREWALCPCQGRVRACVCVHACVHACRRLPGSPSGSACPGRSLCLPRLSALGAENAPRAGTGPDAALGLRSPPLPLRRAEGTSTREFCPRPAARRVRGGGAESAEGAGREERRPPRLCPRAPWPSRAGSSGLLFSVVLCTNRPSLPLPVQASTPTARQRWTSP